MTTRARKPADEPEAGIEPVGEDEKARNPVLVRLVSQLQGHRLRVPYEDDPTDALVIDAAGVYVEKSAVPAIEQAAVRSGLAVQVVEEEQ